MFNKQEYSTVLYESSHMDRLQHIFMSWADMICEGRSLMNLWHHFQPAAPANLLPWFSYMALQHCWTSCSWERSLRGQVRGREGAGCLNDSYSHMLIRGLHWVTVEPAVWSFSLFTKHWLFCCYLLYITVMLQIYQNTETIIIQWLHMLTMYSDSVS